jgi:hypothetical protein
MKLFGQRHRRQTAGAVAGVDAGLFDVLHDAADDDTSCRRRWRPHPVRGVVEKFVDQDRVLAGGLEGFFDAFSQASPSL